MQLSYLNPAQEPVMADAQVQQRSEEVFFSTVQIITVTTKQLVAMGNVSYRLLEART
jgi:acyl-coenzyme A thioesterase PaaI-like protein